MVMVVMVAAVMIFSSTLLMVRGVFTFSVHFIPGSSVHVATLHIGNEQWWWWWWWWWWW